MAKIHPTPAAVQGLTLGELRACHQAEEAALIRDALDACGWSASATARALEVPYSSLQRLLETHGLDGEYRTRHKRRGPGKPKQRKNS